MTHEFKKIIATYVDAKKKGLKAVMATVVALDGSSYRRPGVRMLICEDGKMTGAVSGGCVEKEVLFQAQSVFKNTTSKLMTYDGRYRLGCEGTLYILLEPFHPADQFLQSFYAHIAQRLRFHISSYFSKSEKEGMIMGSVGLFSKNEILPFNRDVHNELSINSDGLDVFKQEMKPCFKLVIIGAEHDAVQLCTYAALTGWEVSVVAPLDDPRTIENFPGANQLLNQSPELLKETKVDSETAVMLMTHSYVKDLKYLLALADKQSKYLGILGPSVRREKLLSELLEHRPDIENSFFESIHGPAGLSIGAETPQEIAISIIAEILATTREQAPMSLKDKLGAIHSHIKH